MKKNLKVVPPQQKYLGLPKIYAVYGSRPVVAYKCKMRNDMPMGGYVIAVLNTSEEPTDGLKAYMKQLKERFAEKEPICYICVREDIIIYDKGEGEVKTLPEIVEKEPSKTHRALEGIPDDILARALITALIGNNIGNDIENEMRNNTENDIGNDDKGN